MSDRLQRALIVIPMLLLLFFCRSALAWPQVLVVHPQNGDFEDGYEGRIMISIKHGGGYHTDKRVTKADGPAQIEDGKVKITAYLVPPLAGAPVYFRVVDKIDEPTPDKDPDDPSPYETNTTTGDNRDVTTPPDIKAGDLSAIWVPTSMVLINGVVRAAAEVELTITDDNSGDNYYVQASMESDFPPARTKTTALLTAWKRVYYEKDKMYRQGSYLSADADSDDTTINVDNPERFLIGYKIRVFDTSAKEPQILEITDKDGAELTLDGNLENSYQKTRHAAVGIEYVFAGTGQVTQVAPLGQKEVKTYCFPIEPQFAVGDTVLISDPEHEERKEKNIIANITEEATPHFYTLTMEYDFKWRYPIDSLVQRDAGNPGFFEADDSILTTPAGPTSQAFNDAYVEFKYLADGSDVVPYQRFIVTGGDLPLIFLRGFSQPWFKNKQRREDDNHDNSPPPSRNIQDTGKENYFHLIGAARSGGAQESWGLTEYCANVSYVFQRQIERIFPIAYATVNKELTCHEMAHQFNVILYIPQIHCWEEAYEVDPDDHEKCLMYDHYDGARTDYTNGIVRFCTYHLLDGDATDPSMRDDQDTPGR